MSLIGKEEMRAQNLISQMNMQNQAPSSGMSMSFGSCYQCGLSHPPLPEGQTCPNAPVTSKVGGKEKKVDLNIFFASLKNIFVSQMAIKDIKDPEKMFKHLIIEVTKILEEYKE